MRRALGMLLSALGVILAGVVVARGAPDAWSEARGGAGVDRQERAPGAFVPPGVAWGADAWWPYAGTGLVGAAVHARAAGARSAWAAAVEQTRSPVHSETVLSAALQLRASPRHGLRPAAGVAARAAAVAFARHPTQLALGASAGCGAASATARLDLSLDVDARGARVRAGLVARLGEDMQAALALDREPGLAARLRAGVSWRAWPGLALSAGYDAAAGAATVGFGCELDARRLAWAARSHAQLGWSHTWSFEARR